MRDALLSECKQLLDDLSMEPSAICGIVNTKVPQIWTRADRQPYMNLHCRSIHVNRILLGNWPCSRNGTRQHYKQSVRSVRLVQHIVMQIRAYLREANQSSKLTEEVKDELAVSATTKSGQPARI